MTISEVEQKLNISRANVRFYEKEGLLFPKRNPINDYRDYSNEDVAVLEKIIFLRQLGISVGTIRLLQQKKLDLSDVLKEHLTVLQEECTHANKTYQICQKLLEASLDSGGLRLDFSGLDIHKTGEAASGYPQTEASNPRFTDVLSQMWIFWDRFIIWGFLGLQLLYSIIVFPFLPDLIPISWNGMQVTEYASRFKFFAPIPFSFLLPRIMRTILYRQFSPVFMLYLDETNAIFTIGAIGLLFSEQVYTVLFLQGIPISVNVFMLICCIGYLLVVGGIILYTYLHRRKGVFS